MSYLAPFFRLVIGGTIYTERWNTSLSFLGGATKEADSTILNSLQTAIGSWYAGTGGTGVGIHANFKLDTIKFNRIGTDGKYMDPVSQTYTYTTPVAGGGPSIQPPSQLAVVATLKTNVARGRAARGRMFLPACNGFVAVASTDGRALAADALRVAGAVSTLINTLNSTVSSWAGGVGSQVTIMSDLGTGAAHTVTSVEVGRVTDTMRSRRSQLSEAREKSSVAITATAEVV